jgi:hypothetical protein
MLNKDLVKIIFIAVVVNIIINMLFEKECNHHYYIISDSVLDFEYDFLYNNETTINAPLKTISSSKFDSIGSEIQIYPSLPCPRKSSNTVTPSSYLSNFANNNIGKISIDTLFEGCSINQASVLADYCKDPFNYTLNPDMCYTTLKNFEIAEREYKRNGSDLYAENCEKTQFLGKNGFLPK